VEKIDYPRSFSVADIKHAIQIAAKPETVYRLVATANGFKEWWAEDVTTSADRVELGFFNRTTIYRLKLEADEPNSQVRWHCETGKEWAGTHIVFQLEARGSNTLLRFIHSGWAAETEYFTSCNTTWGELVFRLKSAAEGRPRGPLFLTSDLAY
jgi:uncharacterized protein YndB with AHSA1/START domain